jgi:hypothetical protein
VVQNVTQNDEVEGSWLIAGNIFGRPLRKDDAGSVSLEKPSDPCGDVYRGEHGARVVSHKPLRHRTLTATNFQDSAWPRHPNLQAPGEIIQIDEKSTIGFRDPPLVATEQIPDQRSQGHRLKTCR